MRVAGFENRFCQIRSIHRDEYASVNRSQTRSFQEKFNNTLNNQLYSMKITHNIEN